MPNIPIFRPLLGEEELAAVGRVFRSGWLGPGPEVQKFEEEFAAFAGVRRAVAVNSCTAALHLSLLALDLEPGDEVLVPSLTFASTAHAALYCGLRVRFVDVEPETLTIDPDDLERKITNRSRVVIPVHYAGHPCQMAAIHQLAERHGLLVIEDAAHAAGATYRGRRIGGLPGTLATCFSFNAVKNLSVGEGGMVTTDDARFAEKIRRLRWMGIDRSTYERSTIPGSGGERSEKRYQWYYEIRDLGYKYVMSDILAAIGRVRLAHLGDTQTARRELARTYRNALQDLGWLSLPHESEDVESAWHLYVIRCRWREALRDYLQERGIATGVHYLPLHHQPLYRKFANEPLPHTERLAREILTLPFHPNLSGTEIDEVLTAVRNFHPPVARPREEHEAQGQATGAGLAARKQT